MLLEKQFAEIEKLIDKASLENKAISKKGIDWHLDHTLKVLINVPKALKKSESSSYKSTFNFWRFVIFTLNWIPRGKGKAPKHVRSFEEIKYEDLILQFEEAKKQLESIEELSPKSNFKHPYFGVLNLKQTKKFLRLHTEHHLKICRDILP